MNDRYPSMYAEATERIQTLFAAQSAAYAGHPYPTAQERKA